MIVVVLYNNGKYSVYYGGHSEADSEYRLMVKNLKKDEPLIRECTRIEIEDECLVYWG